MILTNGTVADQDPQPDTPRLCPYCHVRMQAVVIVVAEYRPPQTVFVCLECSYTYTSGGGPAPTVAAC